MRQAIWTMGKVFTPEEVAFSQIPQIGAHQQAATFIMDTLVGKTVPDGLEGALIYGSVPDGMSSLRSDVDFLVAYDPNFTTCLDDVAGAVQVAQDQYHVPVELTALSTRDIQQGWHGIDPLFLRHLLRAQNRGRFCYGQPASLLDDSVGTYNISRQQAFDTMRDYCREKTEKFAKAVANDRYIDPHLLQRALEAPKNIGRKVLYLTHADTSVLAGQEIVSEFVDFVDKLLYPGMGRLESNFAWLVERLGRFDEDYTSLLGLTIDDTPEMIGEYTSWLEQHRHGIARFALEICQETGRALDTHQEAIVSAPQP